jgi:hypothetical protein
MDGALGCSRDLPVGAAASCRIPGLEGEPILLEVVDPGGEIREERGTTTGR